MPRLTRPLRAFVVAALIGGCAAPAVKVAAFRPADAGIWSAAAFAPARIAGDWQQAAAYAAAATPGCAPGAVSFAQDAAGGLSVKARLCLNGQEIRAAGPVEMVGPGRLRVAGMQDWWVIWVDWDYRTLAIATPDGRFGFVLDRGRIAPDRLTAAAEIFEFNGYDKARLRPF